jgi:anti-anti-sigma factor
VSDSSKIFVGEVGGIRWIRVEGKGSVQNSAALKDYIVATIDAGAKQFIIDLENCGGMDSTFIGTITGIALRIEGQEGFVGLVNPGERILQLVKSLGLDEIFEIDEAGEKWQQERRLVASGLEEVMDEASREEKARVSLEAHEILGEVNDENLPKFRDVVEYLKNDLG